jgi:hypothetical protein
VFLGLEKFFLVTAYEYVAVYLSAACIHTSLHTDLLKTIALQTEQILYFLLDICLLACAPTSESQNGFQICGSISLELPKEVSCLVL